MINIAVASKHEEDRKTISNLLTQHDDFHIISVGEDGYDALQSAMTQQPDIIIMDFSMHDIESPDLAPIIKRKSPSTALIVLCSHNEPSSRKGENTVAKALNAGISGYLLRQEGLNNLASSVRSVFYGITYGHTDREIAKNLNMSIGSLRNCVSQVKKKTGLHNRTQITVHALLAGIISIGKIIDRLTIQEYNKKANGGSHENGMRN